MTDDEMNILLTNDDGFEAPGLHAAFEALTELGKVHIVAPATECSACSHMLTLKRPIIVTRREVEPFGWIHVVEGLPADCVRLGVTQLIDEPIDLVVAGVNRGANAGVDVFYSGTAAGAREGAILKIPSIAVSQALREGVETDWQAVACVTRAIVITLMEETLPASGFWNVNYPAPLPVHPLDSVHRVPLDTAPAPMHFRKSALPDGSLTFQNGSPYWERQASGRSDYLVVSEGGIAITAVPLCGSF